MLAVPSAIHKVSRVKTLVHLAPVSSWHILEVLAWMPATIHIPHTQFKVKSARLAKTYQKQKGKVTLNRCLKICSEKLLFASTLVIYMT